MRIWAVHRGLVELGPAGSRPRQVVGRRPSRTPTWCRWRAPRSRRRPGEPMHRSGSPSVSAPASHVRYWRAVAGRDWAVRAYRSHLQAVLKRRPATVNSALAAVDDFYIRRGLGPARALRVDLPDAAPRALEHRAQVRYLRRPWEGQGGGPALPPLGDPHQQGVAGPRTSSPLVREDTRSCTVDTRSASPDAPLQAGGGEGPRRATDAGCACG